MQIAFDHEYAYDYSIYQKYSIKMRSQQYVIMITLCCV